MTKHSLCGSFALVAAFGALVVGLPAAAQDMYVLDGFGGVHAVNGAPVITPLPPYFGFDVARDLSLVPGTEAGIDYTAQSVLSFGSLDTCYSYETVKSLTVGIPPATTTRYVSCRATGRGVFQKAGKFVLFLIDDSPSTSTYDQFTYTGAATTAVYGSFDDFAMQKVYTVGPAGGVFHFYLKACREGTSTTGTARLDDLICNVFDERH